MVFNNKLIIQWGKAIGAAVSGNNGNKVTFPIAYTTGYSISTQNPNINNDAACRWVKIPIQTLSYFQCVTGWVNAGGWAYESQPFTYITIGY